MAETNNINTNGAAQATAALRTPRAQKREVAKKNESGLSVRDLILIAVLLAAGAVLKLTVSSFFSFAGMKPNFIIAMYCLAIILVRPKLGQSLAIGLRRVHLSDPDAQRNALGQHPLRDARRTRLRPFDPCSDAHRR